MEQQEQTQGYVFQKEVEIRFYDCDTTRRSRISTLMRYIADIAGIDYTNRGYDYQWLYDRGMVFLLSRVSIRIHNMPAADDRLMINTWEHGKKGALFYRDFEIRRPDGELMASAATAWLLVDPASHKVLRPSAFTGKMQCYPEKIPDCFPAEKVKLPEGMDYAGDRRVVYSDLDANGHINNANYGNIAMDVLPEEVQTRRMTDFLMNYNHEAKQGDNIALYISQEGNEYFVEGQSDGHSCFSCRITFAEE